MKAISGYGNQIAGVLALVVLVAGYLLAPDAKLDRLAHVLTTIGQTTGGQMIYAALVTLAIAVLRWALAKVPTGKGGSGGSAAMLLVLCLGASLVTGCGASPLQVGAVGVTVSLRALHAVDDAYLADLDQRQLACGIADATDPPAIIEAHNACVDSARDHDGEAVLDALDVAINGIGSAVAVAAEIDAGQDLPTTVLDAIRRALALFDQIEAVLVRRGIAVPSEIALVVHALGSLVGAEAVHGTALMRQVSRVLIAWRASLVRS